MQEWHIELRTGPGHRTGACGVDGLRQRLVLFGFVHGGIGGGVDHDGGPKVRNHGSTGLRVRQVGLIPAEGGDLRLPLQLRGHLAGFAEDEDHGVTGRSGKQRAAPDPGWAHIPLERSEASSHT